jgi:magnesium transporter
MNALTALLDRPTARPTPSVPDEPPSMRSFFRLADGRPVLCDEAEAQIIAYNNPGPAEEAELLERFNIDNHTLQSSLDPEELSRL